MPRFVTTKTTGAVILALLAVASLVAARDKTTPDEWLQKMTTAMRTLDYEGMVITGPDGHNAPVKVVHKKIDGVVNERIVMQEGRGLELIRIGDEVRCILPDERSVLIEHWENASSLFPTLPSTKIDPGAQYQVLILERGNRVAGRSAVKLAIKPIDAHRYEHRFWLDEATGFPLRTELIDENGVTVDQLKFADISLNAAISERALAPSFDLDDYTWYTRPGGQAPVTVESAWFSEELPAGFRLLSSQQETMGSSEQAVTHIVYGDGMVRVSVFVAENSAKPPKQRAQKGASNSYSIEIDGYRITAVGEVPAETVRVIASSMQRQ